jgi:hypothetical protein
MIERLLRDELVKLLQGCIEELRGDRPIMETTPGFLSDASEECENIMDLEIGVTRKSIISSGSKESS